MTVITRDEAKGALGITGTESDAQIDALLASVTGAVEGAARRLFSQATVTAELHAGGDMALPLSRYPVASITTVTDKQTGRDLDATEYELHAASGQLYHLPWSSRWDGELYASPFGAGGSGAAPLPRYAVTYLGGPTTAPADVKAAAFSILAAWLSGALGGLTSEKDGDYTYKRAEGAGGIPPDAAATLSRYAAAPI
jgi:hypothetical protein